MKFYIFNNGLVTIKGMSGSDNRVYHWTKYWQKDHKINLILPQIGKERFNKHKANFLITDKSKFSGNHFLTYIKRVFLGCQTVNSLKLDKNSVIYSSSDLIADSLPAIFLKIKNKPSKLICGLHLLALRPQIKNLSSIYYFFTQRVVISFLKKWANLVLVSNSLDKEFLLKMGFSKKQVLVTYGGVDFENIPKKIEPKYQAAWIGRLHEQKGIDDLFLLWQKVIKKIPQAKLLIIGEDNLKEYFDKQEYSFKLKNNIIFTGYLSEKELFKTLSLAQVFLFPSKHESFGMVIAEAMACGLPVLAYDLPVFKNIWQKGMLRADLNNISALAKKTLELLENKVEREKMAKEAREYSKNFSWDKTAKLILDKI